MRFLSFAVLVCFCEMIAAQQRIPGQLIVQLDKNAAVKEFRETLPPSKVQVLSKSWNILLLTVSGGDEEQMLKAMQKHPQVMVVQYNHRISKRVLIPNDSLFSLQWSLDNNGQSGGKPDADIDAPEAWDYTTSGVTSLGDTIVVAMVDEGFDLQHEDLHFWKNRNDPRNGIDDDLNGYIDDYNGWDVASHSDSIPDDFHGTHIAGIAAAKGNNDIGITGVAWNVQILPVSFSDYTEAEVVQAYSYIYDTRKNYNLSGGAEGAFVVAANSSFGIDFGKPEDFPIWCAMYDSLGSVGVLSVASTMNLTADIDISGDIPSSCTSAYLITVTNTTRNDTKNNSAAFGYTTVDLGAPGTAIQSTVPGDAYVFSSGTSMASPQVAGAVAMLYGLPCPFLHNQMQSDPAAYALMMKRYILSGADLLNGLDGFTVSGGRLNLFNSVRMYYNECISCVNIASEVHGVNCHNNADGAISITVSGGAPPYHILWSTGDTTPAVSALDRAKYSVKVTDANGCEKHGFFEITEPFPLVLNMISDSATNGENGSAAAFVSGGTMPYTYLWNDPLNTTAAVISGVAPGEYTLTVTDSNGCIAVRSIRVGNIVGVHGAQQYLPVLLSPNPTGDFVWIEFSLPLHSMVALSVYDISGRILTTNRITAARSVLNLSGFPQGNYYIKMVSEQSSVVKKIAKL